VITGPHGIPLTCVVFSVGGRCESSETTRRTTSLSFDFDGRGLGRYRRYPDFLFSFHHTPCISNRIFLGFLFVNRGPIEMSANIEGEGDENTRNLWGIRFLRKPPLGVLRPGWNGANSGHTDPVGVIVESWSGDGN